jgi:hypothetical protein
VAIYHLSVKTVSRSDGRTATAAAAYRAGAQIVDDRTGEIHDYRRKKGIVSATLFVPEDAPAWASKRAELWNKAEESETRKNSTVAREFEVALPDELNTDQRQELAHALAVELVKNHRCAVDVAIHEPGKEGDTRNHHAHILCTTRRLGPGGFGDKTRELDDRANGAIEITLWRERWAEMTNDALARAGRTERVDHRTLAAQGIDREPTIHLGPAATAIERRGKTSQKTLNQAERKAEQAAKHRAKAAAEREADRTPVPAPDPGTTPIQVRPPAVEAAPTAPAPRPKTLTPVHQVQAQPVPLPRPARVPAPAAEAPHTPTPRPVPQPDRQRARSTAVPTPPPPPIRSPDPAPAPTLAERLQKSFEALMDWIKGQRGVLKEINAERSTCYGPVVQLDDHHAVQHLGRGTYSIHRLDQLDKIPALDDPKTEIKYADGLGKVSGPGHARGLGR